MSETFEELESSIGVPAGILERSADARAEADDKTTEAVVAEWTGEEAAPAAAPVETAPEEAAPPADATGQPSADSLSGEALLAAAAEAKGIPLSLVERSARARADADGIPVEEVMRSWVVEAGLAAAAGAVADVAAEPATPPAEEPAQAAAEEPGEPEPAPAVEVLEPTAELPTDEQAEVPARISRYPAWLAAAMVVIPLLAVMYVMVVPDQPSCGSAGQLAVDPATGTHANCDGTPFGEDSTNILVLGGQIYAASCAVCHGPDGGGGAGPALAGGAVLETFPEGACETHIEWVTLGSIGWPSDTYGAQDKPVQGGMPPAALTLTEEEIAQVTLYERVALGGEDQETAEAGCGFAEEGEAVAAGP